MSLFEKAKEAVSLEAFFLSQGMMLQPVGAGLRAKRCPSAFCETDHGVSKDPFKVSLKGLYWRCWHCGKSGDVVRAAAYLWQIKQSDAAKRLVHEAAVLNSSGCTAEFIGDVAGREQAIAQVVKSMFDGSHMDRLVRHALHARGISNAVIDEGLAKGLIAGLPNEPGMAKELLERKLGKSTLLQAGLWRDESTYPAAAFRPLWIRYGDTSFEVRRIAATLEDAASPKALRYGVTTTPIILPGSDRVVITKSAIDAFSMRSFGELATILAMPGESSWRSVNESQTPPIWFNQIQRECEIVFAGTPSGRTQAQALKVKLMAAGIVGEIRDLPEGLDINDVLLAQLL